MNYSDYLSGTGLLDLKNGRIDLAESRVKEAESMQIRVYWPRVESYERLQGEI